MQPFADCAIALGQLCFDKHMDIFCCRIQFQRTAFQIGKNLLQAFDDGAAVFFGNNAAVSQHGGMCNAALNILPIHSCIKCNGGIERIDRLINFLGESARPHFCHC